MADRDQSSQKPFRVIVVGAGLVGLSLSHALQLANIDHVVLEKHKEIVSIHGAALMIYPGVSRVFDQFGILQKIQDTITPIQSEVQRWPDGTINIHGKNLETMSQKFDMPLILFDRQKCVTHLYDGLPDKSFIRTNARVDRIEHTDTSVKVYLTDGTYEEGDIVIGADGVHSVVRQMMWDYAAQHEPDAIPDSDKTAMYTQYKGMFGVSSRGGLPSLGDADVHTIYGQDVIKLLFTQPGVAYWGISFKDEYSKPPKAYRPDHDEQESIGERLRDIKMTDDLTFGQLWENRTRYGVLNIEEGILEKWYAGRIVLVGDSAHKMTAELGLGANIAIESAISLCNILQRFVTTDQTATSSSSPNNKSPNPALQSQLTSLFAAYQSQRFDRAKAFVNLCGKITRSRSYDTWWNRIFITRIATLPWMQKFQVGKFIKAFSESPKLEYVGTRTINEGAEGWKLGAEKTKGGLERAWVVYAVLTVAVGVSSYVAISKLGMSM